jgi:branched-chain amino acid transport system ATP-binding protein/urea transport system ATP-binding protein
MLEVKNGGGSYTSANIIKDINIHIREGEIKAILGRNGVGKSTLMRYLAGVLPKRNGKVFFQGVQLPDEPNERAMLGIAYVPQGREIFPRLTVVENIKVSAFACGHNGDESIEVAFRKFPALQNRAHVMGGKLSGGQQQILALARALAMKPKLILLDEPTEGIQPSIISEIQEILLKLNQEDGITVLFTEQNLGFAQGLSKSCYLMDKGTIQTEVAMSDLNAGSDLVHEMLGI